MDDEVYLPIAVGVAFLADEIPSFVVRVAVHLAVVVGVSPGPLQLALIIQEVPRVGLAVPIGVLLLLAGPFVDEVIPDVGSAVAVGVLLLAHPLAVLIKEPDVRAAVSVLVHLGAYDLALLVVEELAVRP